jgi:hypothetical protein
MIIRNLAELAKGVQYCRASRKLLADSVWGNQGRFQTYSKSQKNGQDGSNSITPTNAQGNTRDFSYFSSI